MIFLEECQIMLVNLFLGKTPKIPTLVKPNYAENYASIIGNSLVSVELYRVSQKKSEPA